MRAAVRVLGPAVLGLALAAGCDAAPGPNAAVEVRTAREADLPPPVGPGGCPSTEHTVSVRVGQEPVCLRGPLEAVSVVYVSKVRWSKLRWAELRVRCGCAAGSAVPGPAVGAAP